MSINRRIRTHRAVRRILAALVGLLLLALPGVVLAAHQFNDVGVNHPFHNQITAIADAGITAGFDDGGYHPSEAVTRQAMAAFMERGFGRAGQESGPPLTVGLMVNAGSDSAPAVAVQQVSITVPGANSGFNPM